MLSFILYLLLLLSLIYYNGFFRLFSDDIITRKQWTLLFLGKALAVPVFYLTYTKLYGGIEKFDTGKFYNDVLVLSDLVRTDFGFFVKLILGLQDDTPGSDEYLRAVKETYNWNNGTLKDYLYNDNRIVIRTHMLLNVIAFGSYLTHGLFNCFLSFIGILFLYKTFKEWFREKELLVLMVLCFFPSLWFYTGALLKEGLTVCVLGCSLYSLKTVITQRFSLKNGCVLLICTLLSFLLKPYLLVYALLVFSVLFALQASQKMINKSLVFILLMALIGFLANLVSIQAKGRSLTEAAMEHHRRFVGMTKGGIFLTGNGNYVRLKNDTSQLIRVTTKKDFYQIRKNATFMYWKGSNRIDTFYCQNNSDTLSEYQLVYIIPESQSNLTISFVSPVHTVFSSLYYTLFYPNPLRAKNLLQRLASIENILLLITLLLVIYGLIRTSKSRFLPLVFLFFAGSLCVLIGITAPNSGAIFRYRSPALLFILLSALYYYKGFKKQSSN